MEYDLSDPFKLEAAVLRYLDMHDDWRNELCDYADLQEYLEDLKKIVDWKHHADSRFE